MKNKGILLIVSGPAGSGKGTAVRQLIAGGSFVFSVSATTRAPREEDKEGVTYYFLTKEKFTELVAKGEMLEHTEYVGNFYGTPKAPVEKALQEGKNVILEIETDGAMQVKRLMPEAVSVMLLPPDFSTLEARLRGRGTEDEPTIRKRMKTAEDEVKKAPLYDYLVISETGKSEEAAERIRQIVECEKCRSSRRSDFIGEFFGK